MKGDWYTWATWVTLSFPFFEKSYKKKKKLRNQVYKMDNENVFQNNLTLSQTFFFKFDSLLEMFTFPLGFTTGYFVFGWPNGYNILKYMHVVCIKITCYVCRPKANRINFIYFCFIAQHLNKFDTGTLISNVSSDQWL